MFAPPRTLRFPCSHATAKFFLAFCSTTSPLVSFCSNKRTHTSPVKAESGNASRRWTLPVALGRGRITLLASNYEDTLPGVTTTRRRQDDDETTTRRRRDDDATTTVEGQPWVPVGSLVGPRFLAGIRGFPQKIRLRPVEHACAEAPRAPRN